jgi:cystathionine gamma-synthase/methionine-gamma-lyase
VLGGCVITDETHAPLVRALAKTCGPNLGAFEAYLAMRGVKTFPLRMERQCANACRLASWLATQPAVAKVFYPADPAHPDSATIRRLFPKDLYGAVVSFELAGAGREQVFAFMNRLKLVVRATSVGDVHTIMLYPAMSSHRDLAPKQRQRMGVTNSLVRLSVGIEAVEDIQADLARALGA